MNPSPITPAFRAQLDQDRYHEHRLGFWLPRDRKVIVEWTRQLMKRVRDGGPKKLDHTLQSLKDLVDTDPVLKPLSEDMFTEVPNIFPYNEDPEHNRELHCFEEMLSAFNSLLTQGPAWNDVANKVGLIGCPFNAILDWPMATASGYMFFLYPNVNHRLKKMLKKWEEYLTSPASTEVLPGWLGPGLPALLQMANEDGLKPASNFDFPTIYKCPDPNNPSTYGFESWDKFFVRDFNDGMRPVDSPDDDLIITHACESAPLQYPVSNVQLSDNFQGKNQCYSLVDMMHQNPLAQEFVGGTVYQAFLSCLSYHQWHAPVSGTIKEFHLVPGTYYSQNLYQTFFGHWPDKGQRPDPAGPTCPTVGLVCFIAIGMTDTSGCEINVVAGQHVKKGDLMGKFHFGGSSHCLVFGPKVKLNWTGIPPKDSSLWPATFSSKEEMPNFPVRSMLATVVTSTT